MNDQEKMAVKLKANEVFRPGTPIDSYALFAGRIKQVQEVIDAIIQPGRHAVIYGERGVGKTSLARVLFEILSQNGVKLLNSGTINCDGTDDFSKLWHKVFRELSLIIKTNPVGFHGPAAQHIACLEGLLSKNVSPDDIRFALSQLKQRTVIILDEVDRIKAVSVTTLLADTIKNLSDHATDATIILIGVAHAVDDLISEHKSIDRALAQIQMPRMSKPELEQIIDKGLPSLGMTIEIQAKQRIVKLSQGLPHYTHLLGLNSVAAAVDTDKMHIEIGHVYNATRTSVEKSHIHLSAYTKATTSPQKQNLYEEVLIACALAETNDLDQFSASAVSKPLSQILKKTYHIPAFARHLAEFCAEHRGPILQREGVSRRYTYRFVNPLLQPFIIMRGLSSGVLTDEILAACSPRYETGFIRLIEVTPSARFLSCPQAQRQARPSSRGSARYCKPPSVSPRARSTAGKPRTSEGARQRSGLRSRLPAFVPQPWQAVI